MAYKKKLLLLCEGDKKIGLGHIRRSMELFLAFQNRGVSVFLIVMIEEDIFNDFFLNEGISLSNIMQLNSWDNAFIIKKINSLGISLVLLDTYYQHKTVRRYINNSKIKSVSLDYFRKRYRPDIAINLYDQVGVENFKDKNGKSNGLILTSSEFAIIRSGFKLEREKNKNKNFSKIENILIMMGGADKKGNAILALKMIKREFEKSEIKMPKINLVIGPLYRKNTIENIKSYLSANHFNCMVMHSPRNVERLFGSNDVVFCGGGTTLLEAMSVGLPAFVIPQTSEELNHATYHKNSNCCFVVDDRLVGISMINESRVLTKISKNGMKAIDQKGAEKIWNILKDLLGE